MTWLRIKAAWLRFRLRHRLYADGDGLWTKDGQWNR